jgi:hypothetical protein
MGSGVVGFKNLPQGQSVPSLLVLVAEVVKVRVHDAISNPLEFNNVCHWAACEISQVEGRTSEDEVKSQRESEKRRKTEKADVDQKGAHQSGGLGRV